ncbi:MAG: Gx transporter family protein [Bacilli bacterium]|nr:Gx transporter family protein [Bacilli bacterium]
MKTKNIALFSLMLALGVIVNYIEFMVPLPFLFPGAKLGIANSLGIILLYFLGVKYYFGYSFLRVLLSAILFSGFGSTFLISLGGTILAVIFTLIVAKFVKCSIYGISITGAIFHGFGQVIVVSILYQTVYMLTYMLILTISGLISGILVAYLSKSIITKVKIFA